MTSLLSNPKQSYGENYYISVGSLIGKVFTVPSNGVPSTASWAAANMAGGVGLPVSTLQHNSSGVLLKDLGKTYTSSLRTFRRIQLVLPNTQTGSTFGVQGRAAGTGDDYVTGYIELGFEGMGAPAPVARFGR